MKTEKKKIQINKYINKKMSQYVLTNYYNLFRIAYSYYIA